MAEHGYYAVSRKAHLPVSHGGDVLWNEKRSFSRWEAWQYMFAAAAYEDNTREEVGGELFVLQRGETRPLSIRYLATAWGWTEKKVRGFIAWLEKDGRASVSRRSEKGHSYIIVNYGVYQPQGHSKGTARAQQGHKVEEVKEITTYSSDESDASESKTPKRKRNEYTPEFEEAWDLYPPRPGDSKMEAFKAWSARIREGVKAADMLAGTEQYHRYVAANRTEPRYIKRAATFYGPNLHWTEEWDYGLKAA